MKANRVSPTTQANQGIQGFGGAIVASKKSGARKQSTIEVLDRNFDRNFNNGEDISFSEYERYAASNRSFE